LQDNVIRQWAPLQRARTTANPHISEPVIVKYATDLELLGLL
jgi:hypothetical protein